MSTEHMIMVVPLPTADTFMQGDLQTVIACFLLMKQAGQAAASLEDLRSLCRDYSGYTLEYDPDAKTFVLRLRIRVID